MEIMNKKKLFCGIGLILFFITAIFDFSSNAGAATGAFDRDNYLPSLNDSNDYDRAWISVTDTSVTTATTDTITITVKAGSNNISFVLLETSGTSGVFTSTGSTEPAMYPIGTTSGYAEDFNGSYNYPALGTSSTGLNLHNFVSLIGGNAKSGTSGKLNVSAGDTLALVYSGITLDTAPIGFHGSNNSTIEINTSSSFPIVTDSLASPNVYLSINDPDENINPVAKDVIGFAGGFADFNSSKKGSSRVQIEVIDHTTGTRRTSDSIPLVASHIMLIETGANTGKFQASGHVFSVSGTIDASDLKGNLSITDASFTSAYAGEEITLGDTINGPWVTFRIIETNHSGALSLIYNGGDNLSGPYIDNYGYATLAYKASTSRPPDFSDYGFSNLSLKKVVAINQQTSVFGTIENNLSNTAKSSSSYIKLIDNDSYCMVSMSSFTNSFDTLSTVGSIYNGDSGYITLNIDSFQLVGAQSSDSIKVSYFDQLSSTGSYGTITNTIDYGTVNIAPAVETLSASNVTENTATLNGTVNANGNSASVWFEYDTERGSYNYSTTIQTVTGSSVTSVSSSISSLSAGTTYYCRVAAENSVGTTYGNETSFITSPDSTAPGGTISINGGANYTNTTSVVLTLFASDDTGVTGYYFSESSTTPSSSDSKWNTVTSTTSYNDSVTYILGGSDGSKTLYVWYKDGTGNVSSTASDSITLDTTSPTVSITGPTSDSSYTTTGSSISLSGSASDSTSGVSSVTWQNSTTGWSGTASGTTSWSISSISLSSGSNSITITATDNAGNTATDSITVTYNTDSSAPSGSISINSGSSYTTTTSVTLTLSATDSGGITGYYLSTNSSTPSSSASGWTSISSTTSYSASVSYTLSNGDGSKTVYVWYKDSAGNVSSTASDSITLDTTAPSVSITSPTSDSSYTTTSSSITLSGSASDNTSGVNSVTWSNGATGSSGTASGTTSWSISSISLSIGSNSITVTATDNVGNTATDSITVTYNTDSSAPSGTISINSGSSYTNTTSVTLTLSATDSGGITGYYLSASSSTPSSSASGWTSISSTTSYSASVSYTLSSGDGSKTVYVWYKDSAGNVSSTASDSITLDTTAPSVSITSPTSDSSYTTTGSSISLSGSASDSTSGVSSVTWRNSTTGSSGTASGTTNWSVSGIILSSGSNTITVTAADNARNTSTDTITVTYNAASAPTATTGDATDVTSSTATLNGTVNANGSDVSVWFEYGKTSSLYDSSTANQMVTGSGDTSTSTSITGLSAGTTYYYRIVAQNSTGATYGSEVSFTTTTTASTGTIEAKVSLPQSIYVNKNKKFKAKIKLSSQYSIEDILCDSITCEGAPAVDCKKKKKKLIVKFNNQDLDLAETTGTSGFLQKDFTLTGELSDGTKFEGSDSVYLFFTK